jgi:head-tail adaptor
MTTRVELLKPVPSSDRFGAEFTSYEVTRTVHAERVSQTGARSEEVGEHFSSRSVRYNIRDAHPVQENWRVRQVGGYVYTVVAILPNHSRGFNTLVCERVNE